MADQPGRFAGGDIFGPVVDEQRLARRQAEASHRQREDRGIGFHQPLLSGHDDIMKAIEKRGMVGAERLPELGREIGDGEQRHAGRVQRLDDLGAAGNGAGNRLAEVRAVKRDQFGMVGMARRQLRAGLRERAANIVLAVPVEGDDSVQEMLERRRIGDQAGVEMPGMPVEQDEADVEDDGPKRLGAQPWRALKRRFVLLMT